MNPVFPKALAHVGVLASIAVLAFGPLAAKPRKPAPRPTTSFPVNLLRNGSFEGGLLHWHDIHPSEQRLVRRKDAPAGEYVLRSEKGWFMSAPMLWQQDQTYTITLSARADTAGEIYLQVPPTARERAQATKRIWDPAGTQKAKVGPKWQRVSFSAKADLPTDGFWVSPTYSLFFEGSVPIEIDAVTVTLGAAPSKSYVPRRPLEIVSEVHDLPGYAANGNLFEKDQTIKLTAHVSNSQSHAVNATVRWQLIDYEGVLPRSRAIERKFQLAPGKTLSETLPIKLESPGTVLARTSVWIGGKAVDQSDFPVTSLPYPQTPSKPDARERFGASVFGPVGAKLARKLGFSWTRWYPHTKWQDSQPKDTNHFHSFKPEVLGLEALGISTHIVLYGWPKWIMTDGNPLPKDMRWKANDPRWQNLKIETAWDRYIKKSVQEYRNRAVIYEIENEPELDHWDKLEPEYAQFTLRTAKLIKRLDPKAKVMLDNLFSIPSSLNRHFFAAGGAKYIDAVSWHEYREGWLADELIMKRMRTALDQLGGKHVEIWFNEGWTFSNTAVDQPIAATHLTSAQSTNAMVDSVVEITAAGQDKTILFHLGYEDHGLTFWDYYGPGTALWDWYDLPMPLVGAWNMLNHHLGLSERVGSVRPEGANLRVFQDIRNGRGVLVAYADREVKADVTVELPFANLIAEDAMGHRSSLTGKSLILSKTGRPVFLYSAQKLAGKELLKALAPLDREHLSFVNSDASSIKFPPVWAGTQDGSAAGNPQRHQGKPVWRLDQVFPDVEKPGSYRPLTWDNGWWKAKQDTFGDQPKAEMKAGGVRLEFRAPTSGSPKEKLCGLVFVAPRAGRYVLSGNAQLSLWDGKNPVALTFLSKSKTAVKELSRMPLSIGKNQPLLSTPLDLAEGQELVILPRIAGGETGGDVVLTNLEVGRDTSHQTSWALPKVSTRPGPNNVLDDPLGWTSPRAFRLDQLLRGDFVMAENYKPLFWNGVVWSTSGENQVGDATVDINQGTFEANVFGPNAAATPPRGQKTLGLVFLVPRSGSYRARGSAWVRPSKGLAPSYQLAILNKDTQRAVTLKMLELPRSGAKVAFDVQVELAGGHELVFLPFMAEPGSASKISVENLSISLEPQR